MTTYSNPRLISSLKSFSQAASATAILVGCLVLVGWMLDIAILKRVLPGLVTMKANTALAFILAGVSLGLLQKEQAPQWRRRIAKVCAFTAVLVGLLTLSEYLFGWDLGLDQLLFQESLEAVGTSHPGRMAPATALNFLVLGLALLLLDTRCSQWPVQFLTFTAAVVSLLALIGYVYGVQSLYGIGPYTQMALHTAVLFIVLSSGVLCVLPHRGLMAIVTNDSAGGIMAHRLLPAALAIPAVLGWLTLEGQRAGFYDAAFGTSLFVMSSIVIFAVLIWRNALSLDRMDRERKGAEALKARARQQAVVAELGQRALAATDLPTLMNEAVVLVAQTLELEYCKVLELLPNGNALLLRAGVGWEDGCVGHATVSAGSQSQAGYTLLSDEPVIVEDLRTETRFSGPPLLRDHGVVSGMSVIIPGGDRPFGVLGAHTTRRRTFTNDDIHFLQAVANVLASAIDRTWVEEALREMNMALANTMPGISRLDAEGRYVTVNETYARMLGYEPSGMIGMDWALTVHPDDRGNAITAYHRMVSEGKAEFEARAVRKDGPMFHKHVLMVKIVDKDDTFVGHHCFMRDITERKRVEEALREINDTLEAVIQASPMGITILDSDGNVKLWNPASERIFGWRQEEVFGRPLPSIPPDKREEHRALRERVLRGEGFSGVDVVRQKKDRSLVDISLSTAPLRDAKGDICGAMGIMADISGRKRAEATRHALYQASLAIQEPLGIQERLDRLLQTAQTVLELDRVNILLADPAGQWLEAVASFGVEEPLEAIRVPIGPAGGALAEAYRTQQAIIWDGRAPLPAPLRLKPPYDRITALRSQVFANVPLVVQGRAIGVLGADRKHSRRPLDAATRELLQLFAGQAALAIEHGRLYETQRMAAIQLEATVEARTRELQAANLQLEEASRHKSEFLATMSHELRTPLNSVLGFTALLEQQAYGPLTAKQARYVTHIHQSGQHLLALISDLLDLSKVEAGKLELRPEVLDLREALDAVLAELHPQAEAKRLTLELQVTDAPATLIADPLRFKQILCNLLSNAVKFTPAGGIVTVTTRRGSRGEGLGFSEGSRPDPIPSTLYPGDFIEIAVADTGIGIPAEDLPKLFQPFTQLEPYLTRQHQGTGLGLALTKRLVELHGGQIFAASEGEGRGSTFTVRLPLGLPDETRRVEDAHAEPEPTPRPAPGG
jgi:PAS domain S-box-containing protein